MRHDPKCVCKDCFPAKVCADASAVLAAHGRDVNPADRWIAMYARADRYFAMCESPAEEAFLAGLRIVARRMDLLDSIRIKPQAHVMGQWRVDFWICIPSKLMANDSVIVEVDGHAFHDRTLEQAQNDRARDRALTSAGWRVIRFTASEVFADAVACARQAIEILNKEAKS